MVCLATNLEGRLFKTEVGEDVHIHVHIAFIYNKQFASMSLGYTYKTYINIILETKK